MLTFGSFFDKEWQCGYIDDPCSPSENPRPHHDRCGWRWVADLNEYDYEMLKNMRLVK